MTAALRPGDPVIVTRGASIGLRGEVVQEAATSWLTEEGARVPMLAGRLPMPLGLRVIRADWLQRSEVRP